MHKFNTPILFLVFNRLDTTKRVFEAIREAKPPRLYIAADGARAGKENEGQKVKEVREYVVSHIDWDCEIKTLFRDENLGCKYAVSGAIDWFFENEEMGIILEDDCLPNQSFFWFCEELLERYKDDTRIGMISGTNYLFGYNNYEYSYYFSKLSYIWGWATWRRSWKLYDINSSSYPSKKFLKNYFKNNLVSNYYLNEFNHLKYIGIDTWDIGWVATLIKNRLYSAVPINNQVSNIGYNGTHTGEKVSLSMNMPSKQIDISKISSPPSIYCDKILDNISIKNIVYKVIGRNALKNLIMRIVGYKILNNLRNRYNKFFKFLKIND